jgi:hypothetical protein
MATISNEELDRLFEEGVLSIFNEEPLLRGLINARVYVHVPVSDDSKHIRVSQFRHPDGYDAIPFFTTEQRSEKARSKYFKTFRMHCVDLFFGTAGATLVLNPNDGGLTLYPEEIRELMSGRTLGLAEKVSPFGESMDVRPAMTPPKALLDTLSSGAAVAPFIKEVYVLEKREANAPDSDTTLLVYLGAEAKHMERAARHMVLLIQKMSPRLEDVVDVAAFDAGEGRPDFLNEIEADPIYSA